MGWATYIARLLSPEQYPLDTFQRILLTAYCLLLTVYCPLYTVVFPYFPASVFCNACHPSRIRNERARSVPTMP